MLYGHCVHSFLCPLCETGHGEALLMLTLAGMSKEKVRNKCNHARMQATATSKTEVSIICPCRWCASFETNPLLLDFVNTLWQQY